MLDVNHCPGRGRRSRRPGGFTLIETALTTIIVGVGVLAIVAAQAAFHQKNDWSTHASVAMHLGNEIREMTMLLPRHDPVVGTCEGACWGPEVNELSVEDYDDLDDFDGAAGNGIIFEPPLNARREVIDNMDGWSQEVHVYNVNPFDITTAEADGSTTSLVVEVIVRFQSPQDAEPQELTRVAWISPN